MPDTLVRNKWALLIGINAYPNLSKFEQLEGCVNDVHLMAGILRDGFGFAGDNISVVTDAAATRDGILSAMESLAEKVGENDIVVMHYSGHGSQMTDREGDEPDGMDETIVPHDGGRDPLPNRDITDDEINEWLLRVSAKTPYVTLLFDCCHSGTIARDVFGGKARHLQPDTRPVEELPPSPVGVGRTRGAPKESGPSGWLPLSKRYVLIAGCRDDESSYEYKDPESKAPHGALTYFLSRALTEATPGTTYRDVYERVRPAVTANSAKQQPQMEGALDRELFGVHDIEPMQFAPIVAREGQTVSIAAGAAHGLTVGSEWTVYPAATKAVDDSTPSLGRLRITQVGAVSSDATLVEENEQGVVDVGTRAVETSHHHGDLVLRIAIRVPEGQTEAERLLVAEIEPSALLRIEPANEPADVCVYLIDARTSVAEDDSVPQLGPLTEPMWAAIGTDGRLVMPVHAASEAGVASILLDNLEKIARYRIALGLDNPDFNSDLRGKIDVRIKRKGANGGWIDAEPEEAGGEVVFEKGERLAITITNKHSKSVYINALDFGLAYAVQPLSMPGANEELKPGMTQEMGLPKGIPLGFPSVFPFVQEPGDAARVEGIETLKIFATLLPTDFSALTQQSVRSVGLESHSSLSSLLRHTFKGVPMRDMMTEEEIDEEDDWTTVMRTFVLRQETTGVPLDAGGGTVDLGAITIRTPGLDGQARLHPQPSFSARTRSVERVTDELDTVLNNENVGTQQTIEIQEVRTRSLTGVEPTIEVEVPDPGEETGQFLLYTDESGVATWQFAQPDAVKTRGAATRTYVIRGAAPAPTGEAVTRGLVGAVGTKLIKLLVFPLIDPILGKVGDYFAGRWEAVSRPYGIRSFTPDNFRDLSPPALDAEAWQRLSNGRSLLFVHGTFSQAHSAFGGLSSEAMVELNKHYDGRVFAFDHFSLSHDPKENVEWLLENLPDDAALDLDIICHSRGGLVSRVLAEKQSEFSLESRSLNVGKVVFVASPNAGTDLADAEHMGDLIDTYTNLLNFIPDNPVTDILDGVITVAKQLAVGAVKGLDGLQSMRPGGEFQTLLNAANGQGETSYFALGADYTPAEAGFKAWAMERLTGKVFGAENDLVVPTASVYEENGSSRFPIVDPLIFPADAGISHTTFFQNADVQEQLLTWLKP